MSTREKGRAVGTIVLKNSPSISCRAAVVGPTEGEGPLAEHFDYIAQNGDMGEKTWEAAESALQKKAIRMALNKGGLSENDVGFIFAGDLLNQCAGSGYAIREFNVPCVGLFGACSTMAESLALAGVFVDNSLTVNAAAVTSSHFCTAERQFRFPVNYGKQRPPTAQWTATASGCAVVSPKNKPPFIKAVTFGKIIDAGIKDANNMGGAMAGAACDTISSHLKNTNQNPEDFDLIITGDLGRVGSNLLYDLLRRGGIYISDRHKDCGLMLYDFIKQDVHAGGSGCGCSAAVLCGYFLKEIEQGRLNNILFAATGALMSPTLTQQGESIPAVAHAVHISSNSN